MTTLNKEIKNRRTTLGLSQRDLAEMAGVSRSTVAEIERNVIKTPSNQTLYRIFEALADEDYNGE